ncbi:glycosyltransferase family 32 protein [Mucilaginibacter sp.]|uniref:glycosyltransferase family 32 protein n=1 Tax=Mucilaginibacter sp. TaxID=1882438 RepID=UPI003AFF8434
MLPKIIHHVVGPKTNEVVDRCLASWQVLQAEGYEFMIWKDPDIEVFLTENYPQVYNAFANARNHGEAADIARYILVYHYGGHYIDWDIHLINPHEFLTLCENNPSGYLLCDFNDRDSLASECFAAEKNEPFLLAVIKEIVDLYENGSFKDYHTLWYTGPFRLRDTLKNTKSNQSILKVKDAFVYDYAEIKEMPERDFTQPMIHYWLHSWLEKKEENV